MKKPANTVHMNKKEANNGTTDKANEVPTSAATAPIQNANQDDNSSFDENFEGCDFDEYREEYEAMVEVVTPTINLFKESFSEVENPEALKEIRDLFNENLIELYDSWQTFPTLYNSAELKDMEDEVLEVRRKIISTERKLLPLLPNIENDWRDICEYCECNSYVRDEIAAIISTRVKNEIDADWVEKSLDNEIYRSGDANDTEDRIANLVTSLSNEECACLHEHYESFYALQDDMQSEFERARYDLDIDCPYEIVRAIEESEEPTQEITKILQNHDSFEALETDSEQWDYELHNEIYKCLVTRMGRPNETIDRHLTEAPLALIQFALNCKTISDSLNRDVDPSILNKALRENQEYLSEFSEYRYISDANKRDELREYVCERLWIESPYQELRKKRDLDADSAKPQAA